MSYKIAGIDSAYRMARAILESPIPELIADLVAGHITPVTGPNEIRMRYRDIRMSQADAITCMTHACRGYAKTVGSVLVVTDHLSTIAFGQADDPGFDLDDRAMRPALLALMNSVDPDHRATVMASRPHSDTRTTVEYPFYAMPKYSYDTRDGKLVAAYGTYLKSFSL